MNENKFYILEHDETLTAYQKSVKFAREWRDDHGYGETTEDKLPRYVHVFEKDDGVPLDATPDQEFEHDERMMVKYTERVLRRLPDANAAQPVFLTTHERELLGWLITDVSCRPSRLVDSNWNRLADAIAVVQRLSGMAARKVT